MYYINLDSMSDIDIDEHERQADCRRVAYISFHSVAR